MGVKSLNMSTNNNLIDWLELQDIDLDDLNNTTLNELSAAVSNDTRFSDALTAYVNTAKYVDKLSIDYNFKYCCIKAIRIYPHFNTDLNISIYKEDFPRIIKLLEDLGWSRRSKWSQFKEDIAERGKRKMTYTSDSQLSEIHLYPGLSWHGFEYTSPDDVILNRKYIKFLNTETYNTNNSLDIVSNIGHALFERYKFTAGEIFHVSSIISKASSAEIKEASNIAYKNGWGKGLEKTINLITKLRESKNIKYPIPIDNKILWESWRERFSFQLKNGRPFSACFEFLFNWVWSGPIYKMYSILKKIFSGQSGIEKKYEGLK